MDPEKTTNNDKSGHSKMSDPVPSAVRLQRNQAEKQRRDRLNGYISELATLVPMVKNSSKPVDKVSVLRLAAAHMRLNISCLNPVRFKSKLSVLPSSVASYLEILEKNIGGFIIATTFAGVVVFCSKSVEDFLGYQNIDFMGQSIYNYVPNKEISHFEKKVNSVISLYKKGNSKKVSKSLVLHLQKRPLPRTNDISYQKVQIKISIHSNEIQNDPSKEEKIHSKGKKMLKHKDFGSSALILMFIEPLKPTPKIPMPFSLKQHDVYVTLHGIRGEIIEADHNISTITGYMPCDVLGKSAYEYIFETDVPIAQFAQKAMFTSNDGKGIITYRLKTFNLKYIFLQSTGFLFKDSANEIQRFVCYNRWLSDEEGERELKKFQERFSPASFAARQLEAQNNKVCSDSPEENYNSNDTIIDSSFSAHYNDLIQSSNGFRRDPDDMNMSVSKSTKKMRNHFNESNGTLNGDELYTGNGYLCNQPLQMAKYCQDSNDVDMNVKLKQNTLGNGYEVEKMEICFYYQSSELISGENYVKQEKRSYNALPQSLNSHKRMEDQSLPHYSNTFAKKDDDSAYFKTNEDVNCTLLPEEKMPHYANIQMQNPYDTQTKQLPSSVQLPAGLAYREPPSDRHSSFVNLMPSHMSFYKVTENVSYNNVGLPSDQYNSTSHIVPFAKNNSSHSFDQCNSRQVRLLDDDSAYQNKNSLHLNSPENSAYHNIQSSKNTTYNNNFSPNGDSGYGGVDIYGNGLTNHDTFGYQKIVHSKNALLNSPPESMHSSQVDDSNIPCAFSSLPSVHKWELLNNSSDSKITNRSFNVEATNSKDSRFQNGTLRTYSETVTKNSYRPEEPTSQSCIAIPSANNESNFDSRVNQELYNELDMFFENFPLTDSA